MKKLISPIIVLLLFIFLSACENMTKNNFTVNLKVSGAKDGWVYLQQNEDGNWLSKDSAEIKNESAILTGNIDLPEIYYLKINDTKSYIPVFVEKGEINIVADKQNLRDAKIEGSPSNNIYQKLMTSLAEFDQKERSLSQQYRDAQSENDQDLMVKISDEYDRLDSEKTNNIKEFALKHGNSVVAPFITMNFSYLFDLDDLKNVRKNLDQSIAASKYTNSLNNRIDILKRVDIGQHYVDFTLNDPEGKPLPLSKVADGKYLLVDFWASWCRPCRAENPNVVEAYKKFHNKGFDVFGVSLDKDHDKWVAAIEQDGLTWSHVSDLKYWKSEAGKLYGVQSIPHNVLLNPEGIIIAKDLRGEDLQNKLAELLNK